VPDATVFVEPGPAARSEYGVDASSGSTSLLTTRAVVDLRAEAPGFRTARLAGVTSGAKIMMHPALRARLAFRGSLPRLPDGVSPKAKLLLVDARFPEPAVDEPPFLRRILGRAGQVSTHQGSRRTVLRPQAEVALDSKWSPTEVSIPEPGTYELELMLELRLESGTNAFGVSYEGPRVTIEERQGVQAISFPAPSEQQVEKIVRMLRR
jgi:hypothetical protein